MDIATNEELVETEKAKNTAVGKEIMKQANLTLSKQDGLIANKFTGKLGNLTTV